MYIRCKSCGQLLFVPDNGNETIVSCPACQNTFSYTPQQLKELEELNKNGGEEKDEDIDDSDIAAREKSDDHVHQEKAESSDELDNNDNPQKIYHLYPPYATRQSYHQPRFFGFYTNSLAAWTSFIMAYQLVAQHFFVATLYAIILSLPSLIASVAQNELAPELVELQKTLAQKETFEEVMKVYTDASQNISPLTVTKVIGISIVNSLITLFILAGGIRLFNAFGRGQKASFGLIFSGFDSPKRLISYFLLVGLLFVCANIAGSFLVLALTLTGLTALGIFLYLGVICMGAIYLFFALPFIADSNVKLRAAVYISFDIARCNISAIFSVLMLLILSFLCTSIIVSDLFGGVLSKPMIGFIIKVLFTPLLTSVLSISYLQATSQLPQKEK